MKILVVGGAGHIGSHMVKMLGSQGHQVITFDNLSKDFRDALLTGDFIECDLFNEKQLDHLLALNKQKNSDNRLRYNPGNGYGFSVKQVIDTTEKITSKIIKVIYADRPPGDPAELVANATMAKQGPGWNPKFTDLEQIVETTWQWEKAFF